MLCVTHAQIAALADMLGGGKITARARADELLWRRSLDAHERIHDADGAV